MFQRRSDGDVSSSGQRAHRRLFSMARGLAGRRVGLNELSFLCPTVRLCQHQEMQFPTLFALNSMTPGDALVIGRGTEWRRAASPDRDVLEDISRRTQTVAEKDGEMDTSRNVASSCAVRQTVVSQGEATRCLRQSRPTDSNRTGRHDDDAI